MTANSNWPIEIPAHLAYQACFHCYLLTHSLTYSTSLRHSGYRLMGSCNKHKRNQVHSYNTRNSNTFYLFPARTNIRCFVTTFQGPKIFNSLDNNIQSAATISLFKSRLKTFFLADLPSLNITCSLLLFVRFVLLAFLS